MKEFVIKLNSVREVDSFVSMAAVMPFPIRVSDGVQEFDSQSMLELFCLNLKAPLTVRVDCSDVEYANLLQKAQPFLHN